MRFQRVGDVREREHRNRQPLTQLIGIDGRRQFQKPAEISDLMITPVPNITPRIVWFWDFPVDAFAGDAVRIKSIQSGRVDKLQNEVIDPAGMRQAQGFPILKDVTPVSFVCQPTRSILVPDANIENIPRSGRIPMSTPKPKRQILIRQPQQLKIILGLGFLSLR